MEIFVQDSTLTPPLPHLLTVRDPCHQSGLDQRELVEIQPGLLGRRLVMRLDRDSVQRQSRDHQRQVRPVEPDTVCF